MDGGKEKIKGKINMSKYFGTDGFRGEARNIDSKSYQWIVKLSATENEFKVP